MKPITKAIIPVAGWGTRMLPITKSIEKCMLPVGSRPVIDYVVRDVIAAGIKEIFFVVGEQSSQIESYYRSNIQLNDYLRRKGKDDLLSLVAPLQGVAIHFITQPSTGGYGTSIPVGLANEFIEADERALVIMGDNIFHRTDGGSNAADFVRLIEEEDAPAGLLGVPVPEVDIPKYGIIEKDADNQFVQIVEKPRIEDAPSNLNNASFYIFPKAIFELASQLPANPVRGEFEVTDALNAYVAEGGVVRVSEAKGEYLDCGSPQGWLHANQVILGQAG